MCHIACGHDGSIKWYYKEVSFCQDDVTLLPTQSLVMCVQLGKFN